MQPSKIDIVDENSEIVREVLDQMPHKLLRMGTVVIALIIVALLGSSYFIRYPDVVPATARLTALNAPKPVTAKQSGKLIRLLASNNDRVAQKSVIGYLESTANPEDVLHLEEKLHVLDEKIKSSDYANLNTFPTQNYGQLGELQPNYQSLVQALLQFRNYINNGVYIKRRAILVSDINNIEQTKQILVNQKALYQRDLSLNQTTLDANEKLLSDKVISQQEYREITSKVINKALPVSQISGTINSNQALQNDKQKEILELDNQISSQKILFQESLNNMLSSIEDWKRKNLLIAPVEGKLTFTTFLQENQELAANQTIGFITPSNSNYYLQMQIPQTNFGKIEIGQEVILKFPSYQWQEFGSVPGRIDYISPIPTDSGYLAKVALPHGLITNHRKAIAYREGLIANAEIITKDQSVLQRLYNNIVK